MTTSIIGITGLCHCGCGGRTNVITKTDRGDGLVIGAPREYLFNHHPRVGGSNHPNWNGGRSMRDGYALVRMPEHPRAGANGYVREHILIAEKALGKPLPRKHPVHHVDENPGNNAPGNLVICEDNAYHMLLHQRQRAMDACGDPNARRCSVCKSYDRQEDILVHRAGVPRNSRAVHSSCRDAMRVRRSRKLVEVAE